MSTLSRRLVRPLALLTLATMAGVAAAQDEAPKQFMVLEHKGLAAFAGDPRDAGLKRALEMLPARLTELKSELPGVPPEVATLMDMLPRMLSRPAKIGIAYTPGEPTGGLFNYGIVVSIEAADEAEANTQHERIKGLFRSAHAGMTASKRFAGFTELEVPPPGNLAYGVRKNASGGWRNEVVYGTVGDIDKVLATPAAMLKNGTPLMSAHFDFSALSPAEKMVLTIAPKDVPQIREAIVQLRKAGILGDEALKVHSEVNAVDNETHSLTRIENAGKFKAGLQMSSTPITEAEFRAVPADATFASIAHGEMGYLRDALDKAAKESPEFQGALDQFKDATGVDVRTDILDSVGGSFAMYASDSTGGGGLGSLVLLVGLEDRERFLKAHGKLVTKARELMDQELHEMPGPYVKLDSWKDGAADMNALRFRGLPVPAELCYAVSGKWLILGVTPQAVTAAARQVEGKGDGGLLTNPRVAEVVKGKADKLTSLSFTDTPRMVREGYTILAMAGNAIASGVRSPVDASRDPGLVVPPPNELLKGAKGVVNMTYWEGETVVMEARADRSLLVNAGGMVGMLSQVAPLIAGGAAAAMSADRPGGPFGMLEAGPVPQVLAAFDPWWVRPGGPIQAVVFLDRAGKMFRNELLPAAAGAPMIAQ